MLSTNKDTNKNLKDSHLTHSPLLSGEGGKRLSYTKTNKLITALYMVTDMIDKDEPIRNKLRTLGLEILSDVPAQASPISRTLLDIGKIEQMMSFLNIASAMNFISEMNYAILKKEFLELKGSMQEYSDIKPVWLEEFFRTENTSSPLSGEEERRGFNSPHPNPLLKGEVGRFPKGHLNSSNGHQLRTRIGVQKGSTLMKALSDRMGLEARPNVLGLASDSSRAQDFNILKKQRRNDIIEIIKNNGGNSTIKDIRTKINTGVQNSLSFSEKTLQRELMSMTKDGILDKKGSKRWTHYFMKNQT